MSTQRTPRQAWPWRADRRRSRTAVPEPAGAPVTDAELPWFRRVLATGEPAALLPAGMVTGRVRSDGEERIVGAAPVAGTDWRVLVEIPRASLRVRAWNEVKAIGLPLLALLLLSGLIGLLIARRVWRPLENLTEAVNRFPHGKEHVPISVDSTDEVGELARAFNAMAAQVAETKSSLERRVAELAALSIENARLVEGLRRTAVILGRLHLLLERVHDPDLRRSLEAMQPPSQRDRGPARRRENHGQDVGVRSGGTTVTIRLPFPPSS